MQDTAHGAFMTVSKMAATALALMFAAGEAAPTIAPGFEEFTKWGQIGLAVFLVWWVVAKTIPMLFEQMRGGLADQMRENQRNNSENMHALREELSKLGERLARMESEVEK